MLDITPQFDSMTCVSKSGCNNPHRFCGKARICSDDCRAATSRSMKTPHNRILALALTLAALLLDLSFIQPAQAGIWISNASMTTARYDHTATLLPNGKVLVAGGGYSAVYLSSAELYDPSTVTRTATGSMAANRAMHTATLLPNGKVLVAGGLTSQGTKNLSNNGAELYDPTTGTWKVTGAMATARYSHTATLLPSGKVLVAGGNKDGSFVPARNCTIHPPRHGRPPAECQSRAVNTRPRCCPMARCWLPVASACPALNYTIRPAGHGQRPVP